MSLIRISESDDWIVGYDRERGMYRVSYFEDGHFKDEYWFDCFKEKEVLNNRDCKVFKNTADIENYTFEQIKTAIDDFNRMTADLAKSDKEMYEEEAIKMLTNWDKD